MPLENKDVANIGREMVGLGRLELPTSRLSGVRSNRLSYGPVSIKFIRAPNNSKKGFAGDGLCLLIT